MNWEPRQGCEKPETAAKAASDYRRRAREDVHGAELSMVQRGTVWRGVCLGNGGGGSLTPCAAEWHKNPQARTVQPALAA